MPQPLFFMARHGRTAGNEKNVYRGWSNEAFAQLEGDGRNDAREAGYFILSTGIKFPLIIVDDLARTQESAQIIGDILGISEIVTDKRLLPLNMGDLTGKSKEKYPLDDYLKHPKKMIPGGESLDTFNNRQAKVFSDILEAVAQIHKPILVVGHGSNASYLYHKVNKGGSEVGYEGMTKPGGVMAFTKDGLAAIFKKREGTPQLYSDGTNLSGFVTDEENKPPRICSACKWIKEGNCTNPLVMIDPELKSRRNEDGAIKVGPKDCCNSFQNKK